MLRFACLLVPERDGAAERDGPDRVDRVGVSPGDLHASASLKQRVKAFAEYAGSYQAINYMFLKNQASKYEFANREEDMGEPGLREAKLSYNPVKMLKKYQMEIL